MLRRLVEERSLENPSTLLTEALTEDGATITGKVTPDNALALTSVYACVRLLSSSVASLPMKIYKRDAKGDRSSVDWRDDRMRLIAKNGRPNPHMTGFGLWEFVMVQLLLWGNAYLYRWTDGRGRDAELWPLLARDVTVHTQGNLPDVKKVYQTHFGTSEVVLLADEVIHIKAFGTSPWIGLSPIQQAQRALGIASSAEAYGEGFFERDARPGGVIQVPKTLTQHAYRRLRRNWQRMHQGVKKSNLMGILEEGATWENVGLPPGDAQFLETRRFTRSDVGMIFGVPPHMIGDVERSTSWGSGIEQQGIQYVTYSLEPWLERIENQLIHDMFTTADDPEPLIYPAFLVEGLLRADTAARYSGYAIGRQWGWLSINDIRRKENDPPLPGEGGDVYLNPMNMVAVFPDGTIKPLFAPPAPVPMAGPPPAAPGTEQVPAAEPLPSKNGTKPPKKEKQTA